MAEELRDDNLVLEHTSGSAEFIGFAALLDDARVGTVALQRQSASQGSIRWNFHDDVDPALVTRAIRLGLGYGFESLAWTRIEARVAVDDKSAIRSASVAGLRREGVLRAANGPDEVMLARLSTDPSAFTRDGFIAVLNAGLPRKRAISQGILRDELGRFLLCELTYKSEWDLPGGVIEVGESPAVGLVRELEEELGVKVSIAGLITMNWLPPWRGWDDACLFVFDLGSIPADTIELMTLQRTEIKAVHWCDLDTVRTKATSATNELLYSIAGSGVETYREAPLAAQ